MIEEQWETIGRVMTLTGTTNYEQQRSKMLLYLQGSSGGVAKHPNILKHMGINLEEFKKVCDTLEADGTIEPVRILGGTRDLVVKLTEAGRSWKPTTESPQ